MDDKSDNDETSDEQPGTADMPDLEKILTPNQMLSRLPTTLAQLKAESNLEKLKNEIR